MGLQSGVRGSHTISCLRHVPHPHVYLGRNQGTRNHNQPPRGNLHRTSGWIHHSGGLYSESFCELNTSANFSEVKYQNFLSILKHT